MVDYMIWPVFIRIRSHKVLKGEYLPEDLPLLKAWCTRMLQDTAVRKTLISDEVYEEWWKHYRTPTGKFDDV